jgi:arylsulfatase A-like enzyme
VIFGIGEVVVRIAAGRSATNHQYFFESAVLYGTVGVVMGVGLALLGAVRGGLAASTHLGVLVAAFVFMMGAGAANIYWLPAFRDAFSLAVSGGLAVGALLLAWILARALRGRLPTGPRRLGPLTAALVLVAASGVASLPFGDDADRASRERGADVNVLLVMIDTLRADHLSIYGYERETSPEIDAWARERGVVFDNAMSHAPWTKPATAALLTALYPSTTRMGSEGSGLPPSAEPLAEILSRNGYRTAFFTANQYLTPVFGFDQGVDYFFGENPPHMRQLVLGHVLHMAKPLHPVVRATYDGLERVERRFTGFEKLPTKKVRAETVTRAFWRWLDDTEDDRFFAYVHYVDPHSPYQPGAPFDRMFMPDHIEVPMDSGAGGWQGMRRQGADDDGLEQLLALYDGEIRYLDGWIGDVIEDLEGRGILDETLIVITSDHGEEFRDHGDFGHGNSLYQEQLHIVLMMGFPDGLVPGGRRIPHVVRHVDVLPTILDVVGLPTPANIAGRSLMPILRGEEPVDPPRVAFSEVDRRIHAVSLRHGSHKVIRRLGIGAEGTEAFDLAADDDEQQIVSDAEAPWLDPLLRELDRVQAAASDNAMTGVEADVDETTRQHLRALGYLQDEEE